MTTNITESILNKIEKENIKPKAKWYFALKHGALWVPGILITILGAFSVAGICFGVVHSGWEYRDFTYRNKMDFLMAAVPLLWIVLYLLFASVIVKALRGTYGGYKLSAQKILTSSMLISIVLGIFLYIYDEKMKMDRLIRYPVHAREEGLWFSPEEGRLLGKIEKLEEGSLMVRDKNNTVWEVDMSGFGSTTFPFVGEGKSIRIIGTTTDMDKDDEKIADGKTFIACAVFPWELGEFHRPPTPPQGQGVRRMLKPKLINSNPDCQKVLEDMKIRLKQGERKRMN